MAAILQTTFSNAFSWMKMYKFRLRFLLKFVPKSPINNIPALVQIMAWHQLGNKPLFGSMMVRLLMDMCHSASMSEHSWDPGTDPNVISMNAWELTHMEAGTLLTGPFQYENHLSCYDDSHSEDKMAIRIYYLCNGNSYTGKMVSLHIGAKIKWLPFRRQYFQMHFLEWKCMNFDQDFTEVCSWVSN